MRGSRSGRSWPWAVSLTMGPASTPAAARAANPACPRGKTSDLCLINFFFFLVTLLFSEKGCTEKVSPYKDESGGSKSKGHEFQQCMSVQKKKIPKGFEFESVDLLSWLPVKERKNDRKQRGFVQSAHVALTSQKTHTHTHA